MTSRRHQIRVLVDLIAVAVCAAGAVLALADIRGQIAPFVLLVGAVLGCGWAITGWIDTEDAAYAASLAIAAGMGLVILVSLICVELAWWHPVSVVGAMLAVAAMSNVALSYRDANQKARP